MAIGLNKVQQGGFVFGNEVLPAIFKMFGISEDPATTAAGHSGLWTGLLLGAGGAFVIGGAILGLVSGGAIFAPTASILGPILLHGALGTLAIALGTGLFQAGEKALGFSFTGRLKQLIDFFRTPDANNAKNDKPAAPPALSVSSGLTARLVASFKNAGGRKTSPPSAACAPSFNRPAI